MSADSGTPAALREKALLDNALMHQNEAAERQKKNDDRQFEREEELHRAKMSQFAGTGSSVGTGFSTVEDTVGKIPPEVQSVAGSVLGMPMRDLLSIFKNDWNPWYLFRLASDYGFAAVKEDGQLILREDGSAAVGGRASSDLKEWGKNMDKYGDAFGNYMLVMNGFWGTTTPTLFQSMFQFYRKIIELSKVYPFVNIIRLAIEYHAFLGGRGLCKDPTSWFPIPREWTEKYCISPPQSTRPAKANGSKAICKKFNWEVGCTDENCGYKNICSKCKKDGCKGAARCKNVVP